MVTTASTVAFVFIDHTYTSKYQKKNYFKTSNTHKYLLYNEICLKAVAQLQYYENIVLKYYEFLKIIQECYFCNNTHLLTSVM